MIYDVFIKFTMDACVPVEADSFQEAVDRAKSIWGAAPRLLANRMVKSGLNDYNVDVYGAMRNNE